MWVIVVILGFYVMDLQKKMGNLERRLLEESQRIDEVQVMGR